MWFDRWRRQNKCTLKVPPEGMTAADIHTQSSICTGEMLIGFLDRRTGKLLEAVVVRSTAEKEAFYRAYGFEPPCRN